MLSEIVITATLNGTSEISRKNTSWKKLFASESLLALREEWFSSHESFASILLISDKKYKHPGFKYKNSFNFFNYQLDYGFAHYIAESETTKSNVNKFLTDLLMTSFTKKLSYKNANE